MVSPYLLPSLVYEQREVQLAADPRYENADLVLPTPAHLDERMLMDLGVCPRPPSD